MPRTSREQSATGIYHVMLRGINRQDIFDDSDDYRKFIETLASLREITAGDLQTKICTCRIYAYCIMPNHVHLLIHENDWTVGQCVKYIADIYVRYYNKKYGRIGHLLQDRFRSEPCNDSGYFIVLMRYIHQNPVKAGLSKTAVEYSYSSWGSDYLGLGKLHVCDTEPIIRRYTLEELTAWVEMPMPEKYGCIDVDERRVIPDLKVKDAILSECGLRSISDFQHLSLERRKSVIRKIILSVGARPRQLSRVTGMNYETIRNVAKKL